MGKEETKQHNALDEFTELDNTLLTRQGTLKRPKQSL